LHLQNVWIQLPNKVEKIGLKNNNKIKIKINQKIFKSISFNLNNDFKSNAKSVASFFFFNQFKIKNNKGSFKKIQNHSFKQIPNQNINLYQSQISINKSIQN